MMRRLLQDRAHCSIPESPEWPLVYQLGLVFDSPEAQLGRISPSLHMDHMAQEDRTPTRNL